MADVKVRVVGEDQASETLKGIDASLVGMKAKFDMLKEGAQILGQTFQQAFELGLQGATNEQIAAAFDSLIARAGGATDTLAQMDAAVRGTVDDEELMASATNLLAGATGNLAGAYADALPKLAEMAKAANKLNPSMGTTSQILEDINRGLKTGRFMMLERLGITVDATAAQEAYAITLGKDVDQLTEEEKAMATLNQVLESGSTLIKQVDGDVGAATDKYMQWQVQLGNLNDELAEGVNLVMNDAMTSLTSLVGIIQNVGLNTDMLTAAWRTLQGVANDLVFNLLLIGKALKGEEVDFNGLDTILEHMGENWNKSVAATREATNATEKVTEALQEEAVAAEQVSLKIDGTALAHKSLKQEAEEAASGLQKLDWEVGTSTKKMAEMEAAERAAADAAYKLNWEMTMLDAGLAGVLAGNQKNQEEFIATVDALNKMSEQIQEMILSGVDPGSEAIQAMGSEYDKLDAKAKDLADTIRKTTAEMIFQQAAAGLDAAASVELARSMGLLSEKDYAVSMAIQALRAQYDANRDSSISAAEGAAEYARKIAEINDEATRAQMMGENISMANFNGIVGNGPAALGAPLGGGGGNNNNYAFTTSIDAGLLLSFTDEAGLENKLGSVIRSVVRKSFEVVQK